MGWTVEDRDESIVTVDITKDANNCSRCKYLSMDKSGCNMWCCDVEPNNACYHYKTKEIIMSDVKPPPPHF